MPGRLTPAHFEFFWLLVARHIKDELTEFIRNDGNPEDLLRLREALFDIFVHGENRALPTTSFGLVLDPTEGGWLTTRAEAVGLSRRSLLQMRMPAERGLGEPDTLNQQIDKLLEIFRPLR